MADREIRIKGTGDFSDLIRSAKDTVGILEKTLGKNGIQIFDKASTDFLKQYGKSAFQQMLSQMTLLKKEGAEFDKVIKNSKATELEYNTAIQQRLSNVKKIAEVQGQIQKYVDITHTKESASTAQVEKAAKVRKSFLPGILGKGVSGVAGAAGLGSVSSAIGGGIGAAGEMGLALGGLVTAFSALALIVNEVVGAFAVYERQVPNILHGQAIGIGGKPSRGEMRRSASNGYDIDALMSQRLGVASAFGTGRSSRAQGNILGNIQSAGRGLGLDPMEIIGAGNTLRGNMGANESSKMLHLVLSKAVGEGMDKSQASHFLATTVNLLTEINKSGLQSTTGFVAAMAALTKDNKMPSEMAARGLGGIQGAITGSTGENAQFFRFAAARAGIGKGTMLGSIFATQQGLAGINPSGFIKNGGDANQLKMLRNMGLVDDGRYTQNYAKGIQGQLNASVPNQKSAAGFAALLTTIETRFGIKTPGEAVQTKNIIDKVAASGIGSLSKSDRKKYEDLGKSEDQKFQEGSLDVMHTIAGGIADANATLSDVKFELGEAAASPMIALKEAIIKVDGTLIDLLGWLDPASKTIGSIGSDILDGNFGALGKDAAKSIGPLASSVWNGSGHLTQGFEEIMKSAYEKIHKLLEQGNKDRKDGMKNNPPMINRNK